ncbi:hypothetical protein [Vibrio sp. H11]|uniref:hypothetical protein n=1 Tax=Vibrio sp. H11 TaxID=2565928 RepID=UPI0010A5B486|nr:hypothetical protein [Vibrio sp. H11]
MNLNKKSRLVSLALTIFFGPLGLLYSSVVAALILVVIAVLTFGSMIGPLICWVLAIAIGDHCTYKHNQNLQALKSLASGKG